MLDLVFSVLSQEIGWEERLQNDLFCVEWDVKPQFSQSIMVAGVWCSSSVGQRISGADAMTCRQPVFSLRLVYTRDGGCVICTVISVLVTCLHAGPITYTEMIHDSLPLLLPHGMRRPVIYCFFMVALWNRADHYIFILRFLSIFFFFPRLISAAAH